MVPIPFSLFSLSALNPLAFGENTLAFPPTPHCSPWDISADLLLKGKDDLIVREIVGRVENKAEFLSGIERLYAHPLETSRDEIILMDGRIIDRYSAPATGADRRYYGRVWYFRDITERTTAERRFEGLLEAAPDAMVIVNAAAKMVLVNAQAVDMFGWSRQELIGKDVDILVPRRRRAEHPAKRSEYQRNPSVRTTDEPWPTNGES